MEKIKLILCLVALLTSSKAVSQASGIVGNWQGKIATDQLTLDVLMKITRDNAGAWQCSMDIPGQGVKDFEANIVEVINDSVVITWNAAMATYSGVQNSPDRIEGVWEQSGYRIDLVMDRVASDSYMRPQEPRGELPYVVKEVTFPSAENGIALAGTLTYPESGNASCAILLVTGSGAQDRNEEIFGHKPFLVLADHLTRNGIAVLRYDDRGVGMSTGEAGLATPRQLSMDALGGLTWLRNQKTVAVSQVGLGGHSEGGTIGIMLGAEENIVDFLVLMAAPGTANDDIIIAQTIDLHVMNGSSEEDTRNDTSYARKVYSIMQENTLENLDTARLRIAATEYYNTAPQIQQRFGSLETFYESQLAMVQNPWFHEFIRFDPADLLTKIRCPVLAINGSLDTQVAAGTNLSAIRNGLAKAKNQDVTVEEFEGLNHLFQPATTGGVEEYGQIETTFDTRALETISSWLNKRCK